MIEKSCCGSLSMKGKRKELYRPIVALFLEYKQDMCPQRSSLFVSRCIAIEAHTLNKKSVSRKL